MNIPKPIIITPVLNGYVVDVGCQRVVFDDREKMIAELRGYLDNPRDKQLAFVAKAIHRDLLATEAPQETLRARRFVTDEAAPAPYDATNIAPATPGQRAS